MNRALSGVCLALCLAEGSAESGEPRRVAPVDRAVAKEYTGQSKVLKSYEHLMRTPLTRFAGNPIIRHTGKNDWKSFQVQESFVFVDPNDDSKLIMFYSGYAGAAGGSIGRATASLQNPFVWTDDPANPILSPGASPFNKEYLRLDSMLYVNGTYWLYATGNGRATNGPPTDSAAGNGADKNRPFDSILLAQSADGFHFTWRSNPVLLPSDDEIWVSQGAVLKEIDRWYMYYSYRTPSKVLPGIRLATSNDGIHWTKVGQVLSCTSENYDATYYEWHQILKLGADYVLVSECYDGKHWCVGVAHSKSPREGWTKSARPLLVRSGIEGTFDATHVATPAIFDVGSRVMLFYSGAKGHGSYGSCNWDIGVAVSESLSGR